MHEGAGGEYGDRGPLSFEENIEITKDVVKMAHAVNVTVVLPVSPHYACVLSLDSPERDSPALRGASLEVLQGQRHVGLGVWLLRVEYKTELSSRPGDSDGCETTSISEGTRRNCIHGPERGPLRIGTEDIAGKLYQEWHKDLLRTPRCC